MSGKADFGLTTAISRSRSMQELVKYLGSKVTKQF